MTTEAIQIDALWSGINDPTNGKSYSGAIVATFASGTSTPKAVWTNKEKTLPAAIGQSQFTLDSNGQAFVFGDGKYKINVYAPTDTGLTSPLMTIDGATYQLASSAAGISLSSIYECDLAAAIAGIGSTETTLIVDCEAIIASETTVTVPSTLAIEVINGGSFDGVAGGGTETLNINGPLQAGNYQIFRENLVVSSDNERGFSPSVNVKWFGATGDFDIDLGTGTDDSEAIKRAYKSIFNDCQVSCQEEDLRVNSSLFFPPGIYRITTNGIFSDTGATFQQFGPRVFGEHFDTCILMLDPPTTTEIWFYDNGENNSRLSWAQFENLKFMSTDTTYGSGFNMWADGSETNFKWTDCQFNDLQHAIRIWGDRNGTGFINTRCKFKDIYGEAFIVDNPFMEHWEFYSPEFLCQGDVFSLLAGGGIRVFGGLNFPQADGTAFIRIGDVGSSLTVYHGDYRFQGMHFESGNVNDYLVVDDGSNDNPFVDIMFRDINFFGWLTGTNSVFTDTVDIKANKRVMFDDCILDRFGRMGFVLGDFLNGTQPAPQLIFEKCKVRKDLFWDQFTFNTIYSSVKSRNCSSMGQDTDETANFLLDADINWENQNRAYEGYGFQLKSGTLKYQNNKWPANNNSPDLITILPPFAKIKNILLSKPASGSQTEGYQLLVGNDDKSIMYGATHTTSISVGVWTWTKSGAGANEYYLLRNGVDPGIGGSAIESPVENNIAMIKGTVGSLVAGEWDYADNDALGFSTVYIRLLDPDIKDPGTAKTNWIMLPEQHQDKQILNLELPIDGLIDVGATLNERTVRVWFEGGDAIETQREGYAIIEYY